MRPRPRAGRGAAAPAPSRRRRAPPGRRAAAAPASCAAARGAPRPSCWSQHAPDLTPVDRARIASALESAQQAHQLDPLLVLAIIEQESDFNPHARGPHGSIGLMQVKPFVARDIAKRHGIPWTGPRTLLDPAANVSIGACYLGEMFEMYEDPALAISAYNLGPYRVQRMVSRGQDPAHEVPVLGARALSGLLDEFGPFEADRSKTPTPTSRSARPPRCAREHSARAPRARLQAPIPQQPEAAKARGWP